MHRRNKSSLSTTEYNTSTETNKRLEEFVTYFVTECEAKLHFYHLVLDRAVKKAGKFSDAFSGVLGQGIFGALGAVLGLPLGIPDKGAMAGAAAGMKIGNLIGDKFGTKSHRRNVATLADLVDRSQRDKTSFRQMLVETGYDIFQSFEMQFMGVSSRSSSKDAMHKLSMDAVDRALEYMKKNEDVALSKSVILGKSRYRKVYSTSRGYHVKYKYLVSEEVWNTGELYEKAGLLVLQGTKVSFYRKNDTSSDTSKYGYRRLLLSESWDLLKCEYELDNVAESKSGHFTDYNYITSPQDLLLKCDALFTIINQQDERLAEERIKCVLEETKEDILEEIGFLIEQKQVCTEDHEMLKSIASTVNNLQVDKFFKEFEQWHRETKERLDGIDERVKNTAEGVSKICQESEESRNTLKEVKQFVANVENNQNEIKKSVSETDSTVQDIRNGMHRLLSLQLSTEHKPVWFNVRESSEFFVERGEYLDFVASNIHQGMVAMCGLGGVGKSELAVRYARDNYTQYDNVIWINAETPVTLKDSFHKLYKRLEYKVKDDDGENKDIGIIAQDVYEHFANSRSLFIFDDVTDYRIIKVVLPLRLPPGISKPHVLMTSNGLEVMNIQKLSVGDFTPQESLEFIRSALVITDESQESEIKELANKLHNFPLALQQAVVYIKQEDVNSKSFDSRTIFSVRDYLKEYENNAKELLDSELLLEASSEYQKTTFTALTLSLKRIESKGHHGQLGLDIINIMSYFSSHHIPIRTFLDLTGGNDRKLGFVINLLKDYSIVHQLEDNTLNIHGLIQQVVRLQLHGDKSEDTLDKCLNLLKGFIQEYENIDKYMPHIISVWKYANKYDRLIEKYILQELPQETIYFHLIAQGSNYEDVENLIARVATKYPDLLGVMVNLLNAKNKSPLHYAAMNKDERVLILLVEKGAKVKAELRTTPLHFAARNGNIETVKYLLDNDYRINAQTGVGFAAIHFAAQYGHEDVVSVLLQRGANVNLATNRGFTALHIAVETRNLHIVNILLGGGARVESKSRYSFTPLHLAAKCGNLEIYRVLMAKGADPEAKTRHKFTPLHFAADSGRLEIVQDLLARGVDVDAARSDSITPLHLSALNDHTQVTTELLNKGANISVQTSKGNTALHLAADKGNLESVKILISSDANAGIKNEEGETAFDTANRRGFAEVKEYISQHTVPRSAEDVLE